MTDQPFPPIFWQVHSGMPREAPGSDAATAQALAMLPDLPPTPTVLDIGCGPGAQTLALARSMPCVITAVDTHQPFLDEVSRRAQRAGMDTQIKPVNASMFDLPFTEQFDLIWSEGAIYIIGFEDGLRQWKKFLKPHGYIALTELSWIKENPPQEAWDFWREAYPGMADIAANLNRIRVAGYQPLGHFILPQSAWWETYYTPLQARIENLRQTHNNNKEAMKILDSEYTEIDLYRKYADWYGYVFYIMKLSETDLIVMQ